MRVAIAQVEAIKGDIEKNLENHVKWIQRAIQNKADMVVFPELSLTGYEPELAERLATNQEDARLDPIQTLCDDNAITVGLGLPTKDAKDTMVSMVILQAHKKRITYSKQYLYPPEEAFFKAGKNPLVLKFDTEIVSPAICYETSKAAHCEWAKQQKASIYIASVLSSVTGIDDELKLLSNIAKNNRLVSLMANYTGTSGGYACAGKSSIWNEKGELMGQLGEQDQGIMLYDTKTKEIVKATS